MNILDITLIDKIKKIIEVNCVKHSILVDELNDRRVEVVELESLYNILDSLINEPDRRIVSDQILNDLLDSYTCYLKHDNDKLRENIVISSIDAIKAIDEHFKSYGFEVKDLNPYDGISSDNFKDFACVRYDNKIYVTSFTHKNGAMGFFKKNKSF